MTMTLREAWRARVEIHVYQLVGVLVILTATWAGGIYGLYRNYNDVRSRTEQTDTALCRRWVDEHNTLLATLVAQGMLDPDYPVLGDSECDNLGG